MKKIYVNLLVAMMSGMLLAPQVEAGERVSSSEVQSMQRSSHSQRPGRGGNGNGNSRPGSRPGSSSGSTRPSAPGSGANRPGQGNIDRPQRPDRPDHGNRPGHGSVDRPQRPDRPDHGHRPGGDYRPQRPVHPTPPPPPPGRPTRPGYGPSRPPVMAPPIRPGRPIYSGGWHRPLPPQAWRPTYTRPLVGSFLGLTFGIAFNSALDYLYNSSYAVDGYGQQEVYLRNVSELNFMWDDATLYFQNGVLVRSQFYDSSYGYDSSRYGILYNRLSSMYGAPASYNNMGNGMSATWFGYSGDYVTLEYTMMNTSAGYRYFTILTYGN